MSVSPPACLPLSLLLLLLLLLLFYFLWGAGGGAFLFSFFLSLLNISQDKIKWLSGCQNGVCLEIALGEKVDTTEVVLFGQSGCAF